MTKYMLTTQISFSFLVTQHRLAQCSTTAQTLDSKYFIFRVKLVRILLFSKIWIRVVFLVSILIFPKPPPPISYLVQNPDPFSNLIIDS